MSQRTALWQQIPHHLLNPSMAIGQIRTYAYPPRAQRNKRLRERGEWGIKRKGPKIPVSSASSEHNVEHAAAANKDGTVILGPLDVKSQGEIQRLAQEQDMPAARVPLDPQQQIQRTALQRAMRLTSSQPQPRPYKTDTLGPRHRILTSRNRQLIPKDADRIEQKRLRCKKFADSRAMNLYMGRLTRLRFRAMLQEEKEMAEQGRRTERAVSLLREMEDKGSKTASSTDYEVLGEEPSPEDLYQAFLVPFDGDVWKQGPKEHGNVNQRKGMLRQLRFLERRFDPAFDLMKTLFAEWRRTMWTIIVGLRDNEVLDLGKVDIREQQLGLVVSNAMKRRAAGLGRMREDPLWESIVERSRIAKEKLLEMELNDEEASAWWHVRRKWRMHIQQKNPLSATRAALMEYKREASRRDEKERAAIEDFNAIVEARLREWEDQARVARKEIWMICLGIRDEELKIRVKKDITVYPADVRRAVDYLKKSRDQGLPVLEPSLSWLRSITVREEGGKFRLRQPKVDISLTVMGIEMRDRHNEETEKKGQRWNKRSLETTMAEQRFEELLKDVTTAREAARTASATVEQSPPSGEVGPSVLGLDDEDFGISNMDSGNINSKEPVSSWIPEDLHAMAVGRKEKVEKYDDSAESRPSVAPILSTKTTVDQPPPDLYEYMKPLELAENNGLVIRKFLRADKGSLIVERTLEPRYEQDEYVAEGRNGSQVLIRFGGGSRGRKRERALLDATKASGKSAKIETTAASQTAASEGPDISVPIRKFLGTGTNELEKIEHAKWVNAETKAREAAKKRAKEMWLKERAEFKNGETMFAILEKEAGSLLEASAASSPAASNTWTSPRPRTTYTPRTPFIPTSRLLMPLRRMPDIGENPKATAKAEAGTLTHITATGSAHMVDVSAKALTKRTAIAIGRVVFSNPSTYSLVTTAALKKGDVLSVARIAGIQAAKLCPSIIPLCHPIMISSVGVDVETFEGDERGVKIEAKVSCTGNTGVEMEAMTAVMGAALTVVDMIKAVDKGATIEGVRVVMKEGGRTGRWVDEGWEKEKTEL